MKRLKYVSSINDEALPETTDPEYELLYVDIGSVDATEGIQKKEPVIFENAPSRARRIVRDGDTIVSTVRTYLRAVAPIEQPEENLVVSTGFAVVRPRGVAPKFLAYCLRSSYFIETVVSRSVGVSYPATNPTDVSCIEVPLPPIEEQQTIARFLDAQTARIDTLVAKKRQLIAKLKEKRSALIARTVTCGLPHEAAKAAGLEPNPEMTSLESGWVDAMPSHWGIWKIAHGFQKTGSGTTPPTEGEDWYGGEIPWVTTSELRENVITDTAKKVSEAAVKEFSALKLFPTGSLVIAMYGATIGRLAILGVPATMNQACCVLAGGLKFDEEFLFFWFQAFKEQIVMLASGGGQPNISQEKIRSLRLPCPGMIEQKKIVTFLRQEVGEIDRLIEKVDMAIDRLTEYRQALITSAVTGKINVQETMA